MRSLSAQNNLLRDEADAPLLESLEISLLNVLKSAVLWQTSSALA